MTTLIATVFVLGILIIVHELGHFLAARMLGVTAEKFSVGFGPKLLSIKRGATEYLISAIPFGGYVKLKGEDPAEGSSPAPDAFSSKSPLQRAAIVFAGPLMNLLLPFIFMPIVYMVGLKVPFYENNPPIIGTVIPDMPAEKAGLMPGDTILKIDGKEMRKWSDMQKEFLLNPGVELSATVKRGGEIIQIPIMTGKDPETGAGYTGVLPVIPSEIGVVRKSGPADKAGIKNGDIIISINGTDVHQWSELSKIIRASDGKDLELIVGRKAETLAISVRPEFNNELNYYVIGIEPGGTVVKRYGPILAIREGIRYNVDLLASTFIIFKKLFTLQLSFKSLGGPVTIAAASGEAAKMGFGKLAEFIVFLSIQLGIINLIPFIPILDGAVIVMLMYELIVGREINIRVREAFQRIGIILIILLVVFVTYNDIDRMWGDEILNIFRKISGRFI
ncbi:MAG TPA: RIP metalloprotease RseP [bacterium]